MARVTVEECLDKVDNRFELVLVAAKRAHQLNSGVPFKNVSVIPWILTESPTVLLG